MSIPDFFSKIKSICAIDKDTYMLSFIIILVGISSFFLGRISIQNKDFSNTSTSHDLIKYETTLTTNNIKSSNTSNTTLSKIEPNISNSISNYKYIASKNGKLYYRPDCGTGKRITESNKVFFASATDAEKDGYQPSASCTP